MTPTPDEPQPITVERVVLVRDLGHWPTYSIPCDHGAEVLAHEELKVIEVAHPRRRGRSWHLAGPSADGTVYLTGTGILALVWQDAGHRMSHVEAAQVLLDHLADREVADG